jgi:cardiolipin hydrolase
LHLRSFAVLVTGSYNWTRSAAEYNFENLLVSDDRRHVEPFQRAFEDLWKQLNPRNLSP